MNKWHAMRVTAVAFTLTAGLTACSHQSSAPANGAAAIVISDGSRHHIYDSMDELIGDSQVVVRGIAGETFTVEEQFFPIGLGKTPIDPPLKSEAPVERLDESILVRQWGPAPKLETGREYILFLVPTGLEGDSPNAFYVTGGVAGMYIQQEGRFVSLSHDGDKIPETLTPDLIK